MYIVNSQSFKSTELFAQDQLWLLLLLRRFITCIVSVM